MKVIAFCGADGVGKDYVADRLMELMYEKDISFIKKPFSENVKRSCCVIEGVPVQEYMLPEAKNAFISPNIARRQLMEQVTELGFKISPTYWFDRWEEEVRDRKERYCFVTDYRYAISGEYVKKYNGVVVYVIEQTEFDKLDIKRVQEYIPSFVELPYIVFPNDRNNEKAFNKNLKELLAFLLP